jgi:hypothetical protein
MATKDYEVDGKESVPPYGPTKGTLQALQLLRRMTPSRIDSDFLRVNKIAPGNEYKVVGALRFLGLIDSDGRPNDSSRMLKTKGATYTLALQDIVRTTYSGLFRALRPNELTRDSIYNYFVTEGGLGAEMATKATRFLMKLCQLAEIEIIPDQNSAPAGGRRRSRASHQAQRRMHAATVGPGSVVHDSGGFPFAIALTPETAQMDVDQLTELFRKMRVAFEQSLAS